MDVVIYGLHSPDLGQPGIQELSGHRWVLNDWYQHQNAVTNPDRIYNLHDYPYRHANKDRFIGDWKEEYNRTGADVVAIESIDGIDRCRVIDTDRLVSLAGSRSSLSCSIAVMIYEAINEGYKRIRVVGVKLSNNEHAYQAVGIIRAIEKAIELGIQISVRPMGRLTDIKKRLSHITPMGLCVEDIDLTYWEWHRQIKELKFDDLQGNNSVRV